MHIKDLRGFFCVLRSINAHHRTSASCMLATHQRPTSGPSGDDMARIEKRGARWRARVRVGGLDVSDTFATKADARAWAAKVEADASAGKIGRAVDRPFSDLIRRYINDVLPTKRGERPERLRLERLMRDDELARVKLPELGTEHISAWRDRRLKQVSAASVLREWATMSAACTVAVKEWRWLPFNPFSTVKKPAEPRPRTRRISDAEVALILHACGYTDTDPIDTAQARVGACLLFALETGMRASEICELAPDRIDRQRRVAHLAMTKNGTSRDVPLSSKSLAILDRLGPRLFDITPAMLDALWRKARDRAGIQDLHFHDSRATALTRLARIFNVLELAKISGHKDLSILSNTYYREDMANLATKLD